MESAERFGNHQLAGVMLTSMGALALEVVLTRIFSVTMWYHFAFLAISVALMGSGMAGVLIYLFPELTHPKRAQRWISRLAVLMALSVPLTFLIYLRIPFRPVLMNRAEWIAGGQLLWLLLIYLDLTLPFFLSGMILTLALSAWPLQAGRIYWADLTGASLGCLASIVLLESLGGAGAMLAIGLVLSVAGVAYCMGWMLLRFDDNRRMRLVALSVLLLLSAGVVTQWRQPWVRIVVNKAGGDESAPIYERWNAHSRVTVYETSHYPFFWAVAPEQWEEAIKVPDSFAHALLLIDAVAGTPIQQFTGDLSLVQFLRYDLTSFVYHLIDAPETLVIGPGGGRDVLAALATDAPHVTAVEVNPAIVAAVKGPFADFAGDLYSRDDVSVIVADARGYIDRSGRRYDVIQASLIDTWAAGGSGAFALSENSLYTREAFETYYHHLTDRGYLTVSRWYLPDRPAETVRLVSTGIAGWEKAGVADASRHVAVVALDQSGAGTEGLATALFKRTPFTDAEVAHLVERAEGLGFTVIYAPGREPYEDVGYFITSGDHSAWIAGYPLDVSPATDDRPFFFNLVLIGGLFDEALSGSGVYRTSMEAIILLVAVVGISSVLGLLLLVVLFGVSARRKQLVRPSGRLLGYFCALGLAFMLIEIPTIQKFTVYLGRPVYSLAVVLFSILVFSGLGSLWSSRWSEEVLETRIRTVFAILFVVVLAHPFVSATVLRWTLSWQLGPRLAVAVALLSVLGFCMGIPFPVGIRWVGKQRPTVIPWLWAVNGVMSVLGSALSTAVAIHFGFRITAALAAAIYGIAGILFSWELAVSSGLNPRFLLRRTGARPRVGA